MFVKGNDFIIFFFFKQGDFGIFQLKPYAWSYAVQIQSQSSFKFNTLLKTPN